MYLFSKHFSNLVVDHLFKSFSSIFFVLNVTIILFNTFKFVIMNYVVSILFVNSVDISLAED